MKLTNTIFLHFKLYYKHEKQKKDNPLFIELSFLFFLILVYHANPLNTVDFAVGTKTP